jgi:hypothetical protein
MEINVDYIFFFAYKLHSKFIKPPNSNITRNLLFQLSILWLALDPPSKFQRQYSHAPISIDSVSMVYHEPQKNLKIKEIVHKFQNTCQVRTGCNMVKSSSPNAPNT